ncbi:MAG: hypothetical protein WCO10_03150 [bacterium]
MLKSKITKIIGSALVVSLFAPMAFAVAETSTTSKPVPTLYQIQQREKDAREAANLKLRVASSTVKQLQNRENNIGKIENRIASTTASTTQRKVEQLQKMLEKQKQQMEAMKVRIANKEVKAIAVVENIAKRLAERMTILKNKGVVMTEADALFAEAANKIADAKVQADKIKSLLISSSTSTATSSDLVISQVKDLQAIIKVDLKNAQAKLVATIKAINAVRPKFEKPEKPVATSTPATSTATTTN